jgi:hypothetical protein
VANRRAGDAETAAAIAALRGCATDEEAGFGQELAIRRETFADRFRWQAGFNLQHLPVIDQALVALGDKETVQTVYRQLQHWSTLRYSPFLAQGADHLRGNLALRLGLTDEAEHHFRTGLVWGEREQVPVEQGRCLQGLAEIAVQRADHATALQFFDRAATLFQRYGLALYLQQVLAKKDLLKG